MRLLLGKFTKNVIQHDENFNFPSNHNSNFHESKQISTTTIIKYNLNVIYVE